VDLAFIHRAFSRGADGVFVGGCWPGDCHYVTQGNYDALGNQYLYRALLRHIGVRPERLRLEWIAASEGTRYAELMNEFVGELRALGPLGASEGLAPEQLAARLEAVGRLLPYLKLVERERLRAPVRTEEGVRRFYESEEVVRLLDELLAEKLALSQIVALLREQPLSTVEISARLAMSPSEVARHMSASSRQGLVRYDPERRCFALA
jgi:F420-non-reducing hydrogenase iron-sulfur subunit